MSSGNIAGMWRGHENHCSAPYYRTHINKLLNNEDLHKVNENQHKFVIIGPLFMYESFHLSIWQMTQRYLRLIKLDIIMEGHNDS